MPTPELIMAVAATAELCGRTFSPEAAAMFVDDISCYDEQQVFGALRRCRREVRGQLTPQDVISRLDDGRPGPEEAWALIPREESSTTVWTEEMSQSYGAAAPLINAGELVPARMTFKEVYTKLVGESRDQGKPVRWTASLGHDPMGREGPILEAVRKGRLTDKQAQVLLPHIPTTESLRLVNDLTQKLLLAPALQVAANEIMEGKGA